MLQHSFAQTNTGAQQSTGSLQSAARIGLRTRANMQNKHTKPAQSQTRHEASREEPDELQEDYAVLDFRACQLSNLDSQIGGHCSLLRINREAGEDFTHAVTTLWNVGIDLGAAPVVRLT